MEIIIGENAGFCYGVKRAVDNAIKEAKTGVTYCLGEIVHNQNVIDNLEKERIIFINDIEEAKGKTIIRAHGVPKEVYEKARKINIPLIDLTCPSVLKIQKIVEEYSKKEFFIIIVGNNNHPEIIGIKSRAGNKYIVIANKEELNGNFEKFQYEKNILLISQTTHSSKKFDEIAKELKSRLNDNTNLEIKKTICPSTEIRQKETEKIAKKVEIMIIIGDKKSSNTNKLYDISCKYCNKVLFIANENELDIKEIESVNIIGIMAGASTPKEDIIKVKNKIEEV
ncbi:MAG: 4-hydroxy-3-methylbut-2-enyl diphosphate reductase [Clostridia bacterium]|nr:4-hydroxy-3-methylbut-2-enyl diphosphate reductase [Clostridia bacterium]